MARGPSLSCNSEVDHVKPGSGMLHVQGSGLLVSSTGFILEDGHLPPAIEIRVDEMMVQITTAGVADSNTSVVGSTNNNATLQMGEMTVIMEVHRS